MSALPTFREYFEIVTAVSEAIDGCDGTIEGFFDLLEEKRLSVETVMTSDIAQITLPIGYMKRRLPVSEVAPEGEKAESFILKNKAAFKKRYGDNWERVLYATAWKLFGEKK